MRALLRAQRGAAMVFGLFFALFLLASVYRLHGLAEALLYRQGLQDAADASAFSAAVVNARGMNLIALINMTMAAVLSVLVGLRIAQTLVLLGIGLCLGLTWVTGGASLGAVNPLRSVNNQIDEAAEKVEEKMPDLLSALHTAGKAVSVVVPVGANGRILDLAIKQYNQKLGVTIPGRFTLPVEDGRFEDLCRHAGELAGQIAMLPVSPLVPPVVLDGLTTAIGKLAQAGSGWFCGEEGAKPPDLDEGRKYDPEALPKLPMQQECERLLKQFDESPDKVSQDEVDSTCNAAGVEYLASMPGQGGKAREGEPLCQTDCDTSPRPSCPPAGVELCTPEQAQLLEEQARANGQSTIVPGGRNSPYGTRTSLAREQCDPSKAREHPLGGMWWIQRPITYVYEWVDAPSGGEGRPTRLGEFRLSVTEEGKEEVIQNKDEVRDVPCGKGGKVGHGYNWNSTQPLCESDPVCVDARGAPVSFAKGTCDRRPPMAGGSAIIRERVMRVTEVLRCVELRPHQKVETPPMDLRRDLQKANKDNKNTSPFQLEEGVFLGGSDFQLRAVVIGNKRSSRGSQVVPISVWSTSKDEAAGWAGTAAELANKIGRVGLGQAEYYFDLGKFSKYDDQLEREHVVEWLWNQGWTARLRPFRLNQSKADKPRKKPPAYDAEQMRFAEHDEVIPEQSLAQCSNRFDACEKVEPLLNVFGQGGDR